jgi:hypothetical protein
VKKQKIILIVLLLTNGLQASLLLQGFPKLYGAAQVRNDYSSAYDVRNGKHFEHLGSRYAYFVALA